MLVVGGIILGWSTIFFFFVFPCAPSSCSQQYNSTVNGQGSNGAFRTIVKTVQCLGKYCDGSRKLASLLTISSSTSNPPSILLYHPLLFLIFLLNKAVKTHVSTVMCSSPTPPPGRKTGDPALQPVPSPTSPLK